MAPTDEEQSALARTGSDADRTRSDVDGTGCDADHIGTCAREEVSVGRQTGTGNRAANASTRTQAADCRGEAAGIGSWEWDISAGSIVWSDALCRIYGVEPGARRSPEACLAFVHPDDRARAQSMLRQAYETLEACCFEHRIRRDGTVVSAKPGEG